MELLLITVIKKKIEKQPFQYLCIYNENRKW